MCLWYSRQAVTELRNSCFHPWLESENKMGSVCSASTPQQKDLSLHRAWLNLLLFFFSSSSHTESFCCSLLESGSNTACVFLGHVTQKTHSPEEGNWVCLKTPGRGLPVTPAAAVLEHFGKSFPESPKQRHDRSNIHVAEPQEDIWNPQQEQAVGYVDVHHIYLFRVYLANLEGISWLPFKALIATVIFMSPVISENTGSLNGNNLSLPSFPPHRRSFL